VVGILIGLDHGGSTTTALALSCDGRLLGRHSVPMPRRMPQPGWVEHDAEDFLTTSVDVVRGVLAAAGYSWRDVDALGLANQGETTIAWDASTGRPVGPAVSWQDRRTAAFCAELVQAGRQDEVRSRTGLPIDPYFAASKIRWLLDASDAAREAAARGTLRVGGSDAFVFFRLNGGEVHATDPSTASRTALMDLAARDWAADIAVDVFGIPAGALPEIRPTTGGHFGHFHAVENLGPIPLTADVVDGNAALFAQGGFAPGVVKATYGTGVFVAANVGHRPVVPDNGLLPFVAWEIDGQAAYSVEGGVFDAGTAIDWLVSAGLLGSPEMSGYVAATADENRGVIVVPSFSGLAAPRWQPAARAAVLGVTLDTQPAHLVRAVLEGIACSVTDIVLAMEVSTGVSPTEIRVDGGPSRNAFLMQVQADLLGMPISVSRLPDLTAFGAALMAGVGGGILTVSDTLALAPPRIAYEPRLTVDERLSRLAAWRTAADAVAAYSSQPAQPASQ
jgi:glycerol kinase